jgi:hypothetical protein
MVKSAALSRIDLDGKAEDLLLDSGGASIEESDSDAVGEATRTGSAEGMVRPGLCASITLASRMAGVVLVSSKMSARGSVTSIVPCCTSA